MTIVHVNAGRPYDVIVEEGILDKTGRTCRDLFKRSSKCVIVSDDTVWALYGERAEQSLKDAGFETCPFVFGHGEASKNEQTYLRLVHHMASSGLSRKDFCVSLGGGVPGDLCGFAAATYMRGISFVQIPTTLLAMVDASVGGKTAVDLPEGKNLLGAFWQPSAVLCDPKTLSTLPRSVFADGCAEVIKYGCIMDAELFDLLESRPVRECAEEVIARCVSDKAEVVSHDERETGESRILLNFGHTIGHAIEKLSDFRVTHGSAVAIGMSVMARIGAKKGFLPEKDAERMVNLIKANDLPVTTGLGCAALAGAVYSDKKREGTDVRFVITDRIGHALTEAVPYRDVEAWIMSGLEE